MSEAREFTITRVLNAPRRTSTPVESIELDLRPGGRLRHRGEGTGVADGWLSAFERLTDHFIDKEEDR